MPEAISPSPPHHDSPLGSLVPAASVWDALVSEPSTGVGIVSIDGQILWINEQAARLFHGKNAKAAPFIGKFWRDTHPPEWVNERLAILKRIQQTGTPVLLRTIWRGWQQHTWIHLIDAEAEDQCDEPGFSPRPLPVRFLTITRRVGGDEEHEELREVDYQFIESEVADLGPLETLTPRELEVMALLGQGLTLQEAAGVLFRSPKTIDNHRQSIGRKLNINDRGQLTEIARRAGLTLRDAERTRV